LLLVQDVVLIIWPHLHTTYVDVACCYQPSIAQSVCHTSESCKTAELIEMPFGLRTWVGPGNHILDGVQIPMERSNYDLWGRRGGQL